MVVQNLPQELQVAPIQLLAPQPLQAQSPRLNLRPAISSRFHGSPELIQPTNADNFNNFTNSVWTPRHAAAKPKGRNAHHFMPQTQRGSDYALRAIAAENLI
jgi:hypothetical protein